MADFVEKIFQVTNLQPTKNNGLSLTYQNQDKSLVSIKLNSINDAKEIISSGKYAIKEKYLKILNKYIQTRKVDIPSTNHSKKSTSKTTSATSTKENTKQKETYGVEIDDKRIVERMVTIYVEKETFHDFDEAIEYVKTIDSFQKERLDRLIPRRDNWYRKIWTGHVKRIISEYKEEKIPFTELFYRMNKYYSKDFSEEQATRLLELCGDTISRTEVQGENGNKLAVGVYYSLKKAEQITKPKRKDPGFSQPQIAEDAKDDNALFEADYRRLINTAYHSKRKDIYVGLDFGTSFTKVAYHYTPGDRGIILFGDTPFKPTVVYYDEKERKLSFFKPSSGSRQIQYFKATMIKDPENYSLLQHGIDNLPSRIQGSFEIMCSVFFISNLLVYVRHKLNELFPFDADLSIAMGIPIFGYTSTNTIYNKALHAGIHIAGKVPDPSVMSIEEVFELYNESMSDFDDKLYTGHPNRIQHCTIPELFTEALFLLNKNTYPTGFYYIVDIGGGTSDFAFIFKENSFSVGEFDYSCPSAVVAHLGNEVRKANEGSQDSKDKYLDEFGFYYRSTIHSGKNGLRKVGVKETLGEIEITQLLFGGGAIDPSGYYQDKNNFFTSGLSASLCKVKSRRYNIDDDNRFPQELNLSQDDKQRLIIATQLANPETSYSYLKAWPEQFDHTPPFPQTGPLISSASSLNTKDYEDSN